MRNNSASQLTAAELLNRWLEHLAADRSPATIRRYHSAIRRFLIWYEAQERQSLAVQDLTPIALVGYRTALQKTDATSTVNTHVSALRAWCRWLADQGYVPEDPARRLKLVDRQEPSSPKALEANQVQNLLNAAVRFRHPERTLAILQVLLQTGMRIGECAALTFEDVDFGEKSGRVIIRAGKGNKARIVPLNSSARTALAKYAAPLLGTSEALREVAAHWPKPQPGVLPTPLWRSQKGGAMTASAIQRLIDNLVRECVARELLPPETSAHTLRHTFAKRYLKAHPGDLVSLAALLGHSSLNTTRIYVKPTAEELAERVESIDLNAYE